MTSLKEQDQKARLLALDPHKSFIVQAPAGSGKTELLIQRFLMLLSYVKKPEEILAITFTKKAANEMRERIIYALQNAHDKNLLYFNTAKTYELANLVLERNKKFNWNLLDNPNQLHIKTIDSLCAYLTQQLPLQSQFGATIGITEQPEVIYREAIHEILSHLEEDYTWSKDIATLLLHLDNDLNKLSNLFITLLAKRDQWLPYLHLSNKTDEIKKKLEENLQWIIKDALQNIVNVFPKIYLEEAIALANYAANHVDISSNLNLWLDRYSLPENDLTLLLSLWQSLASLLLTKQFQWRKKLDRTVGFPPLSSFKNKNEKNIHENFRQRFFSLIDQLVSQETLRQALASLFLLPDIHYQETQWQTLKALFSVLKIITAQLRILFQKQNTIDFIENTQAALTALGEEEQPTDLALALDYQICHILVDEFQDTSFTQYHLLEKLITGWEENDGRTLFVVGDPMQSIYRFREAEVGIFIRMLKFGIGSIKLNPITLTVNFRATHKLVEWTNQHFKTIFPSSNDIGTGAVTFTSSIAHEKQNETSQISIFGFQDEGILNQHLIDFIITTKKTYPDEKIAILVRSRSHLKNIIPSLKKAQIAYQAVDIDPLNTKQFILDLLSLTCAMLNLEDKIAWLSLLRTPWCGFILKDIHHFSSSPIIWETLQNKHIASLLSSDGQQRLARILPILKNKLAHRARSDLRTWIESTWILLGGPACLKNKEELEQANFFFEILNTLYQQQQTIDTDRLKEKINFIYAPSIQTDDRLQIMTIHSAKGLEFDTVILPYLEKKAPADEKSLLAWTEQPYGHHQKILLLAAINAVGDKQDKLYEYIRYQQKIKSDFEIDRLLYVATTRAKKRLYLSYQTDTILSANSVSCETQELNFETKKSFHNGTFLNKLWPLIHHAAININNSSIIDSEEIKKIKTYSRLPSQWDNPIIHADEIFIFHQSHEGFLLKDRKYQIVGMTTHLILQKIAEENISWWHTQSSPDKQTYIQYQLTRFGLEKKLLSTCSLQIMTWIEQTLSDSKGQWILQPHALARSEFALSALIDNKIQNFIIDRTFVDENNIRWIIDYKTTALSQSDLKIFLEKEQDKYAKKMNAYAEAMQLFEERPIRFGLYFPAIPAWYEW